MKIQCSRCGNFIDETAERCPSCGAFNENMKRTGNGVPTTIDELKRWYVDHNLPDEEITRFFIGKNYNGPKAIGIYKDDFSGDIVVYKNKDDGSRKVRYQGRDEAYAVNEIYLKLKEEINLQKAKNMQVHSESRLSQTTYKSRKRGNITKGFIIFVIFIAIASIGTLAYVQSKSPSNIVYEANEVATTQGTTNNNSNDDSNAWSWMLFNSDTSYPNSSYNDYDSSRDYSDSWSSSDYSDSWSSTDYFDSWSSNDNSDSWSSSTDWSSSDWDSTWDSSDSWSSDYSDWSSDW